MTPPFTVRTTPRYERLAQALLKGHPEFREFQTRAVETLTIDPYNRSRAHDIRKLEAVPLGEGQRRLALGRFRFRYDISRAEVVLQYCGLRREETYR